MERRVRDAYNANIDLGAHPNVMLVQLAEPLDRYRGSSARPERLRLQMSNDLPERLSLSLLTTAQTGVTIVLIVGLVLPEAVQSIQADDRLEQIAKQLGRLSELPQSGRSQQHRAFWR